MKNVSTKEYWQGCSSFLGKRTRFAKEFTDNFRVDSQIPYFCGDSEMCRTIGSREALEKAKENIKSNFLMVGVLEELEKTHFVLECLKPNLFNGLSDQHKRQNLHVHSQHKTPETIRWFWYHDFSNNNNNNHPF